MKKLLSLLGAISLTGKTVADFEALFEEGKIADGKVVNDTKNGMEGPAGSEDFKGDGKELEIPEGTDIKTSYAFGIDAKKGDTSITVYLNEIEIEGDISKPEDLKFNISIRNEVVLELTKATTPNPEDLVKLCQWKINH
ncbi:hypothetical protein FQR65_LT19007 [Abscondita terminalis]|nr:hypothetical protein FQR65_LT19007 [Abscondita terminalis]